MFDLSFIKLANKVNITYLNTLSILYKVTYFFQSQIDSAELTTDGTILSKVLILPPIPNISQINAIYYTS